MILINKYKIINTYKMFIIDFFILLKYLVYFLLFLSGLSINILSIKIFNRTNRFFISFLYNAINLNGYGVIKLVQWYISNNKFIQNNKYIESIFTNFYENCYIHNIEYSKKVFLKEYSSKMDDIFIIDQSYNIKSGSVAQVYLCHYVNNIDIEPVILKVVHPEIEYQVYWLEKTVNLYNLITKKFKYFNKYRLAFDFDNYFINVKSQSNMYNEYNNLNYYYNYYKNSPVYIIPKPIFVSKNLLIMTYHEGIKFTELQESEYTKAKIFTLLNLFMKNNNFNLDYIHLDMHCSNWSCYKCGGDYKIIIYDFGYCLKNIFRDDIKEFLYYIDVGNISNMLKIFYSYIKNINISSDEFIEKSLKYIVNNKSNKSNKSTCLASNTNYVLLIVQFCSKNGLIIDNFVLETFITTQLIDKYLHEYIYNTHKSNYVKSHDTILFYNSLCKKYDMFPELISYHNKYYLFDNEYKINTIKNNLHTNTTSNTNTDTNTNTNINTMLI